MELFEGKVQYVFNILAEDEIAVYEALELIDEKELYYCPEHFINGILSEHKIKATVKESEGRTLHAYVIKLHEEE